METLAANFILFSFLALDTFIFIIWNVLAAFDYGRSLNTWNCYMAVKVKRDKDSNLTPQNQGFSL